MNTLKELRARVKPGVRLRVIEHYRPELVGKVRIVTKAHQKTFRYQVVGEPEQPGGFWGDLPAKRTDVEFLDADTFRVRGGKCTDSTGEHEKTWTLRFEASQAPDDTGGKCRAPRTGYVGTDGVCYDEGCPAHRETTS